METKVEGGMGRRGGDEERESHGHEDLDHFLVGLAGGDGELAGKVGLGLHVSQDLLDLLDARDGGEGEVLGEEDKEEEGEEEC